MTIDILDILERIAESGTAPREGCSLFGVGYDDAFAKLKKTYLERGFSRGKSAEKFVVGLFGSGKTHFLRQLIEIARQINCVTAEVSLNKNIDFTKSLLVYKEVAGKIRAPGVTGLGIEFLLEHAVEKIKSNASDNMGDDLVRRWIDGISLWNLESRQYSRVLENALLSLIENQVERFKLHCRWLEGEINDRALCKDINAPVVIKAEENHFGKAALLSLCQTINKSGFQGTVIGFDEAEQGFNVGQKQMQRILSMLQSSINAVADLDSGSVLIIFALTPDIMENMQRFPALQQRVADPGPNQGFFDGNQRAPIIPLDRRSDPQEELMAIGKKLTDLLYAAYSQDISVPIDEVKQYISKMAETITQTDAAVSNRRTMAKQCAAVLLNLYESGNLNFTAPAEGEASPEF